MAGTYLVYHHHLVTVVYLPPAVPPPPTFIISLTPPPALTAPPRQVVNSTTTEPNLHNHRRRRRTREVFISFRGPDVRHTFIDHLHAALRRERVGAFRDDDPDTGRGVNVKQGVLLAIDESRFYVVVLTRSYASSKWCLDELVKIMHCSNKEKKVTFPIFYHLSPADVAGADGGCYKGEFDKHKRKYTYERVDGWIQALAWIVGVSGWVVGDGQSEAALVESIARTVRRKVQEITPTAGLFVNISQSFSLI